MAVQLNLHSRAPVRAGGGFSSTTPPDTKTSQAARRVFALLVAALMVEGIHAQRLNANDPGLTPNEELVGWVLFLLSTTVSVFLCYRHAKRNPISAPEQG